MGYVLGYVMMRSALERIPAAAAVEALEGEPQNSDHALQFAPARRFLRPWHVAAAPHTFGSYEYRTLSATATERFSVGEVGDAS
jgi:hypothetical protein